MIDRMPRGGAESDASVVSISSGLSSVSFERSVAVSQIRTIVVQDLVINIIWSSSLEI
jgi:hypothetical protein